jgi:hypothetical protein
MAYALLTQVKQKAKAELAEYIAKMEADPFPCRIALAYNSEDVVVGNFEDQIIDIGDILRLPAKGDYLTQSVLLTHELVEQWVRQRYGQRAHAVAHAEAIKWESQVTPNNYSTHSPIYLVGSKGRFDILWTRTITYSYGAEGPGSYTVRYVTRETVQIENDSLIVIKTEDVGSISN